MTQDSSRLYVVLAIDVSISDFKIYASREEALKNYLKACIQETKSVLKEVQEDASDALSSLSSEEEESFGDTTSVLQVFELDGGEYKAVQDYDVEDFQEVIGEKDDIEEYLKELSEALDSGNVPLDLLEVFV